jgi:rRNA maturation protein Rpf1
MLRAVIYKILTPQNDAQKKVFDALDALFDITQKKMTPKDAQISLKATIFFFSFHKFVFRETKIARKSKKKKSAGRPKTWFSGPSIHEISN